MSDEQIQHTDDPIGPGWAWVAKGDTVREGDMWSNGVLAWSQAERVGETVQYNAQYRRRIEQPQQASASDNVAELTRVNVAMARIIDDLVRRVAAIEAQLHGNNHSLQATVTLEPEWAADIDKFFVSRDAGLQHILRWYYRRAAERKAEQ